MICLGEHFHASFRSARRMNLRRRRELMRQPKECLRSSLHTSLASQALQLHGTFPVFSLEHFVSASFRISVRVLCNQLYLRICHGVNTGFDFTLVCRSCT